MIEIICYVMIGSMLGLMFSALISANKFSRYNQRVQELEHEKRARPLQNTVGCEKLISEAVENSIPGRVLTQRSR